MATLSATLGIGQASAAADVPSLYSPSTALKADVTSDLSSAPESRTLVWNMKNNELSQAQATLSALGQSVQLAQKALAAWNTQLLSSNSMLRKEAWQRCFTQLMHVKRLLPQMDVQEATIARLKTEVAAERALIDTWPEQAGLVGGFAGPMPRMRRTTAQRRPPRRR